MLTILQLVSSEGYYGAESMLVSLARALTREGYKVIVGVLEDTRFHHGELGEEARRRGLPVETVPCAGRLDWNVTGRIRKIVSDWRIDVVHSHGYKADFYAFAAARPRRVALLATSHNWPNRLLHMRAYAIVDRFLLRQFDGVAVVSDVVGDMLRRSGVGPDRLFTVRNGVDIDFFCDAKPALRRELSLTGERLFGFVGRLVPEKGGEIFLRAAQLVCAAYPETRIVFAGDGPARPQWEGLASQLGIRGKVHFTGFRVDMPSIYGSLDFMVLPSLIEAMPMCLIEAMVCGTPIIATNVGATPRVVTPGITGLLVEPGDVAGLAGAMMRLIEHPELARRLGSDGKVHAAEHFSDKAMARSYITLYDLAMANCHGRRRTLALPERIVT